MDLCEPAGRSAGHPADPQQDLWEIDLERDLFAAAAHTEKTELANNISQLRLGTDHTILTQEFS